MTHEVKVTIKSQNCQIYDKLGVILAEWDNCKTFKYTYCFPVYLAWQSISKLSIVRKIYHWAESTSRAELNIPAPMR